MKLQIFSDKNSGTEDSPAKYRGAISGERYLWIAAAVILLLALFRSGGFYTYVSAELNVLISICFVAVLFIHRQLRIPVSLAALGIAVVCAGHFLVCAWALDPSMAFKGGVKFLPFLLFLLYTAQMEEEQKELVISLLPVAGAAQVLLSVFLSRFETFAPMVLVDSRLAGFFQYPNTFAVFLLLCVIISAYRIIEKTAGGEAGCGKMCLAFHIVILPVCLLGIALSGSRGVYVLTAAVFVFFLSASAFHLLKHRKNSKETGEKSNKDTGDAKQFILFCALACLLLLAVCLLVSHTPAGAAVLARIRQTGFSSSTFKGRLLYDLDALRIIRDHLFGLGYYGYRFIQGQYKTGVYSVVNVHNELLQIALDVGIIPCLLMAAGVIWAFKGMTGKHKARNRLLLLALAAHALMDYDFQFIAVCLVLVLLLPQRTVTIQLPSLGLALSVFAAAGICLISLAPGKSDLQYIYRNYETSEEIYPNTVSELNLLTDFEQSDEKRWELVRLILGRNGSASAAYAAAAQLYYQEGDIASMATYQKAAIRTDPYRYTLYTDYLTMLSESAAQYAKEGRAEEAYYCAAFAREIPDMLAELKERTSSLGWQLSVQPVTQLDHESRQILEKMDYD